jgi:hypothetical protein
MLQEEEGVSHSSESLSLVTREQQRLKVFEEEGVLHSSESLSRVTMEQQIESV